MGRGQRAGSVTPARLEGTGHGPAGDNGADKRAHHLVAERGRGQHHVDLVSVPLNRGSQDTPPRVTSLGHAAKGREVMLPEGGGEVCLHSVLMEVAADVPHDVASERIRNIAAEDPVPVPPPER